MDYKKYPNRDHLSVAFSAIAPYCQLRRIVLCHHHQVLELGDDVAGLITLEGLVNLGLALGDAEGILLIEKKNTMQKLPSCVFPTG